jgi:hypothetical protein
MITERNVESFVYWVDDGGTIVDLAGDELNIRVAVDAAIALAPVIERVRRTHLEQANVEANEALRRKHEAWLAGGD